MEFDNDRLIRPYKKSEIWFWVLLACISPAINWFTFFKGDFIFLPILLVINLLLFPLYILYGRQVVARFLFTGRQVTFALLSVAFFVIIQLLLMAIYSIFQFDGKTRVDFQSYFTYSWFTFGRESLWLLLNSVLVVNISFLKKTFDEEDALKILQKETTVLKLKYIRSQVKPHFLFNTLNSIYSLSLQKSDKTPDVIIRLADIMRYLIYAGDERKVPLSKEIEFILNYIEIEKTRFETADIRFFVEGDTDGIMVEPFLFISFIENGFKHALNNSFERPFVYITIKMAGEDILLTVVNNTDIDLETQAKRMAAGKVTGSKGLLELLYPDSYALNIIQTEKQERKISSIGIKNARERLQILYPDAHTLDVIFNNNVFTVALLIKLSRS
ncbi:MAG TPA: sensor histidine kinase [Chitinophagaceae bacterium]|nr:sensor histidine kinase [Chitinophagaceae bacterium]